VRTCSGARGPQELLPTTENRIRPAQPPTEPDGSMTRARL